MRALKNTWYVAAWDDEIQPGCLFRRVLLEKPILFFRDDAGIIHAIGNRCPHRFAPLHMGRLVGSSVQCKYHGLQFGSDGRCVHNPHGNGVIPQAARVPAYPTVERYGAVWIWLGEPKLADPETIPAFEIMQSEHYAVGHGYMNVKANYELETDNILDLSHIEFLHPLFATDAVSRGKIEATQDGNTVWSKRLITDDHLPPFLAEIFGIPSDALADRWLDCHWEAPALIELRSGATLAGRPREEGREAPSVHFFTPETETTTHYWYGMCLPRSLGPAADEMAKQATAAIRGPFETEDLPVLEAQQEMIGNVDFRSLHPVLLPGDGGGGRARRVLEKLIAAEESGG